MSRFRAFFAAAAAAAALLAAAPPARAEEKKEPEVSIPAKQPWSFAGVFGKFDQAQLQRGFQVYKEVCSGCHRLSIPFRTLGDPNGPGYSEGQVKTLAASYKVADPDDLDDKGMPKVRDGRPSDLFPPPDGFPNDASAIAAFGKAPPDMWVLAKARKYERGFPGFIFDAIPGLQYQEMGADYIYAILTGYTNKDDPKWNAFYQPNHQIAMPQPITDGAVKYGDGTAPTLDNYARDVSAFLFWAADPTMVERKQTGFKAIVFLIVLSIAMYFVKKRVWASAH